MSTSNLPVILLLSLEKESWFDDMHENLLSELRKHAKVTEATSEDDSISYLDGGGGIVSVIVTDATLVNGKSKRVSEKLVKYAHEGGTVIFGGLVSNFSRFDYMRSYFADEWGLPWEMSSYHREIFSVNKGAVSVEGRGGFSELQPYSMKAVQIKGADQNDRIYVGRGGATESPVVFAKYGNGNVAWIGDVNAENETSQVVRVMCGI